MRADRLLSLLMLLQTRGTLTARTLADELEVSERTIYRDIDALSVAGVPLYADRGPGGGISLVEDYRTNLTGLSAEETRALFMLSIPAPLRQLGVGKELQSALLKLSAALPAAQRQEQETARRRIHLDASWWGQSGEPGPHLGAVQSALWRDHRLRIRTRMFFGAEIEQAVDPLGLVAKAGEWYLVAQVGGGARVFRVADLLSAAELGETFTRPAAFDLAAFWEAYCREVEAEQGVFRALVRLSPGLVGELPWRLRGQASAALARAAPPDERGWRSVELTFDSLEQARDKILSFGGGAEVLEPPGLRRSMEDFAQQILGIYAPDPNPD
jgi:predicted DNA-binding transcriptional regulator YafY